MQARIVRDQLLQEEDGRYARCRRRTSARSAGSRRTSSQNAHMSKSQTRQPKSRPPSSAGGPSPQQSSTPLPLSPPRPLPLPPPWPRQVLHARGEGRACRVGEGKLHCSSQLVEDKQHACRHAHHQMHEHYALPYAFLVFALLRFASRLPQPDEMCWKACGWMENRRWAQVA